MIAPAPEAVRITASREVIYIVHRLFSVSLLKYVIGAHVGILNTQPEGKLTIWRGVIKKTSNINPKYQIVRNLRLLRTRYPSTRLLTHGWNDVLFPKVLQRAGASQRSPAQCNMQAFSDRGSYVAWNLGGIAATVESVGLAAPDAREQEKKNRTPIKTLKVRTILASVYASALVLGGTIGGF